MAEIEILTRQDLNAFKQELLHELKALLQISGNGQSKQWLRSQEVRKMLNISPGTLQNLRINGTLPFTKVGAMHYYKLSHIQDLMEKGARQ